MLKFDPTENSKKRPPVYRYILAIGLVIAIMYSLSTSLSLQKTPEEVQDTNWQLWIEGELMPQKGPNDLWGYVTPKHQIAISYQFQEAFPYVNGYAFVKKKHKWGMIRKNASIAIPLEYDYLWALSDGFVRFRKGNLYGFVDSLGKELYTAQFDAAYSFQNGLAIVKKGNKYGVANNTGSLQISCDYDSIYTYQNGIGVFIDGNDCILLDTNGVAVDKQIYERIPISDKHYNRAYKFHRSPTIFKYKGKYGLMDSTAKVLLDAKADSIDKRDGQFIYWVEGVKKTEIK